MPRHAIVFHENLCKISHRRSRSFTGASVDETRQSARTALRCSITVQHDTTTSGDNKIDFFRDYIEPLQLHRTVMRGELD